MIDSIWIKIRSWDEYEEIVEWAKSFNVDYTALLKANFSSNVVRITTNDTRLITLANLKWNVIHSFDSKEKNKR